MDLRTGERGRAIFRTEKLAGITVAGNGARHRNWTTGQSLTYEKRAQEIFRNLILGVRTLF